jgi:isopenicillin-N epimerase
MKSTAALPPKLCFPDELRSRFMIDADLAFLNHGSFGAAPREVFAEQNRWRDRIEADPVEIIARQAPRLIEEAKIAVGRWLGMTPANFGLITNATEGVNCVLRSLRLETGDELLTTNHVYNAVRQAMKYTAAGAGAAYREVALDLPVSSPQQIVGKIADAITERTRLLVIDHVTSPTALVFPVEAIIAECRKRNVDVLIDGAHGPGMLPLDIERLSPIYYAGNLHKWGCAPRGCAVLWVRPDRQEHVHPLVVSHHFQKGFSMEFSWQGTRDFSAWFAIPAAIAFFEKIGREKAMAHNHALAVWTNEFLCRTWKVQSISPIDGSILGSMATVPLPAPLDRLPADDALAIQKRLHDEFRVEAPTMHWEGRNFIRPCLQIYNQEKDVHRLAEAIDRIASEAR